MHTSGLDGVEHSGGDETERLAHDLAEDLRRGLDQAPDVQADEVNLMLVDQLPVGDRRIPTDHAVDDDPTGDSFGRGQAGLECRPADGLQDQVGARAAGQPQDLASEVGVTGVDDVIGTQSSNTSRLPVEAAAITVAP